MMNSDGNHVYLLVGPRGSGKSQYAKRLCQINPGLSVISRDEILIRLFGSPYVNPYTGDHWYAMELMHRLLRRRLQLRAMGTTILLDCWTGVSEERVELVQKLRQYGADRITALYFVTPLDLVSTWFWLKPGVARDTDLGEGDGNHVVYYNSSFPARHYQTFHRLATAIDADGFDGIFRVDPLSGPIQLRLPVGCQEAIQLRL